MNTVTMAAHGLRSLRPTWYEIDLGAVAQNVRELRASSVPASRSTPA